MRRTYIGRSLPCVAPQGSTTVWHKKQSTQHYKEAEKRNRTKQKRTCSEDKRIQVYRSERRRCAKKANDESRTRQHRGLSLHHVGCGPVHLHHETHWCPYVLSHRHPYPPCPYRAWVPRWHGLGGGIRRERKRRSEL
jgi:hypothetical protein